MPGITHLAGLSSSQPWITQDSHPPSHVTAEQLGQNLPSTAENGTTGLAGSCWQPARTKTGWQGGYQLAASQSISQAQQASPSLSCPVTLASFWETCVLTMDLAEHETWPLFVCAVSASTLLAGWCYPGITGGAGVNWLQARWW